MSLYKKPSYKLPIFNSSLFTTTKQVTRPQRVQIFPKGIITPFIEFTNDNSMQVTASEKTTTTYLDQNTQLNVQPFMQNNYVLQSGCNAVYMPNTNPKDGYTIQLFNSESSVVVIVSETHKMYNTFYLPTGGNSLTFLPNQMAILKFYEKSWSLLIF
jgi:hypothetical protein